MKSSSEHQSIRSFIAPFLSPPLSVSGLSSLKQGVHDEEATTLSQGRPRALLHREEMYPGTRRL